MLKKRYLKYIIIAALVCYGLFVFVIIPQQRDNDKCKELVISISGNRLGTINNGEIVDILTNEGLYPKGKTMESISCLEIENFVKAMSLVKKCQVYKTRLGEFEDTKASVLGDYLPTALKMEDGENALFIMNPGDYSGNFARIFFPFDR